MSEKLIRLSNLSMTFEDGETILDGINLYINNKEFLTLLGPSGCGKTTTLRIIGGFLTPTSGDVFFNGQRINDVPSYKRKINTVFQRYALFPHLDVYDNIAFGLRLAKLSEEEYNKKVAELVAKIYVIKANFTSTLSAFESNIIASYKALPKEQHTTATKAKIVSDNMGYVTGLEAQCDAQVKAVTDELSALMKENGKDTSLVDAINSAYNSEKELKKAYYISLYK